MKNYLILITAILIPTFSYADKKQDEVRAVQQLTQYDQKCAQFDKDACKTLLTKLADMCKKNSFACFRLGEIAAINSEVAARQGMTEDSIQWLDLAVGSTKRACQLNLPQACTEVKKLKSSFRKSCEKGDQFFCKASKLL
ncbi:MAG: hypothetical protein GKC53_02540 [Neisseriaceae bacterium]|nr:MAG: hypothetical protein GKC53_02540 [Neisseriaceae bacterium]